MIPRPSGRHTYGPQIVAPAPTTRFSSASFVIRCSSVRRIARSPETATTCASPALATETRGPSIQNVTATAPPAIRSDSRWIAVYADRNAASGPDARAARNNEGDLALAMRCAEDRPVPVDNTPADA